MRIDPRVETAPGLSAPLAGLGTAAAIGVAEWLKRVLGGGLSPEEVQSGLLLVAALYGGLGLFGGALAWAAGRVHAAPAVVLGAIAAIAAASHMARPILLLAALALGILVLRISAALLARWPRLPRARLSCSGALVGVAATCALAARQIPAFGPRWAMGAAVAALAGAVLVWTPRVRGSALLAAAGALALAAQGARHVPRLAPASPPAAAAPSVLLVTIDTLRADRVGAYGYAAARTPNLDALAAEGVLFRNAFAHSMFTGPSHASMLTGLLPSTTGFLVNGQGLERRFEVLADAFAKAGYVTAAFPSAFSTAEQTTHLPGRFQYFDGETRKHAIFPAPVYKTVLGRVAEPLLQPPNTKAPSRSAAETTRRAARFLDNQAGAAAFTWVHYFDPHLPYAPPANLRAPEASLVSGAWYPLQAAERRALIEDPARVAAMRGLYDAEIAYVDRELAALVAAARRSAPPGGLWIVVAADHGEPMGEHGHYWLRDLYDETLHVPLVIVPPASAGIAPRSVESNVGLVDLAPTLIDLLELPPLAQTDGKSLRTLLSGGAEEAPRPVVAVFEPEPEAFAARAAAVRFETWKLISQDAGFAAYDVWEDARELLFDVAQDPRELVSVASEQPEQRERLRALLPARWTAPTRRALTPEEREELRALGYLQ